jgi:hypothetical protein
VQNSLAASGPLFDAGTSSKICADNLADGTKFSRTAWFQRYFDFTSAGSITRVPTAVSNLDQHYELSPKRRVAGLPFMRRSDNANNQERRIEARLRSDGSGKATGDREQGRKGQPRWRPQGEFQPLDRPVSAFGAGARLSARRRFFFTGRQRAQCYSR